MNRVNGEYKVIDLFAGAGGFGLGFKLLNSKFKVKLSLEVDKWAVDTLSANNSHKILHGDIKQFDTRDKILSVCQDSPDVIIGGPPCQGFSQASSKKDSSDPRNSLFKNYAQWVGVLKPKVFVMENVKGILSGTNDKGEKVIDIILSTFRSLGYTLDIWELNSANYGVPQSRERVFIVGNRFEQNISKPEITHYLPVQKQKLDASIIGLEKAINVFDAIGDLPRLKAGEGQEEADYGDYGNTDFQIMSRGKNQKLFNHVSMKHTSRIIERYKLIMEGGNMSQMPEQLMVRKRNGNGEASKILFSSNYRHLKPDMVSYTIPASFYSNFIHPTEPRNITSREAARLQSFPDSYVFKGKRTQLSSKLLAKLGKDNENYLSQYNQIGNAVPPLLARAIANRIYTFLEEIKLTTDNVTEDIESTLIDAS